MKITIPIRRARIVHDSYCGYEVQVWTWWCPFWRQPRTNTHSTEAGAETYARRWLNGGLVKEVTK